jgi:hypothetical protein
MLDLLALALLHRAVRRSFGPRAAWVAALLYATNPWVVEFIRWIWYQTLISTFATVAFAMFLLLVAHRGKHRDQKTRVFITKQAIDNILGSTGFISSKHKTKTLAFLHLALSIGLLSATLMGMVHLAAVPWAALLFLLGLALAWRKRLWRGFLGGIGLSLIAAWSYLQHLWKSKFADVHLLLEGNEADASGLNWTSYRLSRELLTGDQVLQTPRTKLWAESIIQINGLTSIILILLTFAVLSSVWRIIRRKEKRAVLLFTLGWALLAPTLFVPTHIHLQHFYLLFLFPAPYVLIGAWLESKNQPQKIPSELWIAVKYASLALLIVLSLWWSYIWTVRISYESRGEMRAVTRAWLMDRVVDEVETYLDNEPEGHVILLNAFEGEHLSPFDWVRNFVHSDRVRIVSAGQGFIIPLGPTCYMLGPGASQEHLTAVADKVTLKPEMTVPASPPWSFACIPSRETLSQPLAQWQNGLSLLQADVQGNLEPNGMLHITYTWHYREPQPKEYHFFNHLMLGDTLVAQVDGTGVPTWYWRDDDVLITRFALPLPADLEAGEYELRVGAYTWPELERVFLVDSADGYTVKTWNQ